MVLLFFCELIEKNGDCLCEIVMGFVCEWGFLVFFFIYFDMYCCFVNSFVDWIVLEFIELVGVVVEFYVLWVVGE